MEEIYGEYQVFKNLFKAQGNGLDLDQSNWHLVPKEFFDILRLFDPEYILVKIQYLSCV
jgi:hypothetical protein